jgi:hypothetical protein
MTLTLIRSTALAMLVLGGALAATACGTEAADAADTSLNAAAVAKTGAKPRAVAKASYRNITIPSGTLLPLALTSSVASDTSAVEDGVTAEFTRAIVVNGREVVPAGTRVDGNVTGADDAGRVKGRGLIAFRFTSLRTGGERYDIEAASVSRQAEATKSEDATKIGIGAGAGAIIGGFLGGKKGAAEGAAVGGGAGTGVVLATKGKEVHLGPGTDVSSRLTAPLTVRLRTS